MKWESNVNNPIIDGDNLFGSGYRTEDSKVAKKGNSYYMVVSSGRDGNTMDIYMLKSNSLSGPWSKAQESPIISRGRFYDFDFKYLRVGTITFYDGTWYLYYSGQNLFKKDAIGVATTSEEDFPFGWRKHNGNPILKRSGIGWESQGIVSLCIKRIGSPGKKWYGHYAGKGNDRGYHLGVCYGEGPYGPFTRYPGNPILGPGEGWDSGGPARADFVQINGKICGAYESAGGAGTPFQVGEYSGNSIKGLFLRNPKNPILSGSQFANPSWWHEGGKIYLLTSRKSLSDTTEHWRYIDLFTLISA